MYCLYGLKIIFSKLGLSNYYEIDIDKAVLPIVCAHSLLIALLK